MNSEKQKKFAASLSITSNALIILLKFVAGTISGSISIISEAIHSLSDFFASVLTFFAVSRSSEPADKEHPFGHGKYEDMSGFIEGGLIVFAGIYIVYKALFKLISGSYVNTETTIGIFVMGFSIIMNIIVSSYLLKTAKRTDSVSLYADGEHLRTDIYSSLGVLIGLVIIKVTGIAMLDPIIAIMVSVIIMKAGYKIAKETLNNLLDGSLPDSDKNKIETILKANEQIRGYSDLRTRKSGKTRDIEMTLFFEQEMSIYECHKICDNIEGQIGKVLSDTRVLIHAEPVNAKIYGSESFLKEQS